jgi:cytochrome c-type biogenesis protein CcsB
MYESITFTAWSAIVIGATFEIMQRRGFVGLVTAVVGLLALILVAQMPLHDIRMHPLRAVLNSYWLNIHVTMMLVSYGAFAIAAGVAVVYLLKSFLGRDALFGGTPLMDLEQTEEFAYRLVQVGWPILTVGICLGAVWADTAWGRYWGWDPKETWAFITWIVYTIYLHSRMVMGWRGRVSALACVIGFIMVLITWLGVSYIPWFAGGLHTYASPG